MHLAWRALVVVALIPASGRDGVCRLPSAQPDHSTALIELYTSEGCDSCPPADRWLSSLSKQKLGDRAVALALHVDYWDRLGWKDRFGSAGFSQRQREESTRSGGEFVYTPQVLLQGRDFPQWQAGAAFDHAIASINARPARAVLDLVVHPREGNVVETLRSQRTGDRCSRTRRCRHCVGASAKRTRERCQGRRKCRQALAPRSCGQTVASGHCAGLVGRGLRAN